MERPDGWGVHTLAMSHMVPGRVRPAALAAANVNGRRFKGPNFRRSPLPPLASTAPPAHGATLEPRDPGLRSHAGTPPAHALLSRQRRAASN